MDAEVDQLLSLAPLDEALADRQQRRGAHRRLFRDMVKGEMEVGPLTWLRRRALVKFAERLDIDRFEAELLIRGVEYEGALIPLAAMPSAQTTPEDDIATQRRTAAVIRMIVMLLLVVVNYGVLRLMGIAPF
ncbi:MAG TPA: hypothetical protein VJZ71_02745 [Phycisphaerae bacterium]|nr:hypothetical protein [Phycisphaerae bacterium]